MEKRYIHALLKVIRILPVVICVAVILLLSSSTMAAQENRIGKANNQFGMDLFHIVAKDNSNILISPLSAHVVLSMAYQGADGETAKNMAQVFHLPDADTTANEYHKIVSQLTKIKSVTLKVANKICIMEKFKLLTHFKQVIETKYLAEASEINFAASQAAAKEINGWVATKTHNKITELLKPEMLNGDTRLVLLNAVYFKGNWANKFNADLTTKKPFYTLSGDEIQVDMMSKNAKFRYSENENLGCKILELPYEGNELSMVIFLPNERNGITKLQEKLASVDFSSTLQDLHERTVNLDLPKFKIESEIPLADALKQLGADQMFTKAANFSKMATEPLQVSDVIQKTFIEVNEEGAEAAAATGMGMMLRCAPPVPVEFIVNHPFTFALVDNVKSIALFVGQVFNPSLN